MISPKEFMRWFKNLPNKDAVRFSDRTREAEGDPEAVDELLEDLNEAVGGHGIQEITGNYQVDKYYRDIALLYVNLGDTYDATVLYDTEEKKFLIGSWGGWVEEHEKEDVEEDGDEEEEEEEEVEAEEGGP